MKKLLYSIFLLALAIPASAQLVISKSDFLSHQSSNQTTTDFQTTNNSELQALINLSGANQTWTFGGADWTNAGTSSSSNQFIAYPGGAALANDFPTATHVQVNQVSASQTLYDFYQITDNGVWVLGETQDSAGVASEVIAYTPAMQLFKFPLTYQTSWYSSSTVPASLYGLPNGTTITMVSDGLCDGYGTLSVPGHSESTLRLRWRLNQSATYLSVVVFSSTTVVYSWLTQDGYSASISTDSSKSVPTTISGGSYSIPSDAGLPQLPVTSDPLTLRLSQNPAANTETNLYYTLSQDGPAKVMLMDPLGREVKMLVNGMGHEGQNEIAIDPAMLSNGNYFLRVSAEGKVATLKLQITK